MAKARLSLAAAGHLAQRQARMSLKPKAPTRILSGKNRKLAVEDVLAVLKQFRVTPFEYEGACRAGLREHFCLGGHSWQRADHEAAELVREAFMSMGAKRPTWLEGQPEHLIARENCQHCNVLLSKEAISSGARFCSDECQTFMKTHRAEYHTTVWEWAYCTAHYVKRKQEAKPKPCVQCGEPFSSPKPNARFCGPSCAIKARQPEVPERSCIGCGKRFKPRKASIKNCSTRCASKAYGLTNPERACVICSKRFAPVRANSNVCSDVCKRARKAQKMRDKRAARVPFVCEPG